VVGTIDCGWNDLGSWANLFDIAKSDANGNVIQGHVHTEDVKRCYIQSNKRLVAALGIEDQIIVETADAILVANKKNSHNIKILVDRMKQMNLPETILHLKVYRPWGYYEVLDESSHFKVKRLSINPKASLSLQMHHHRCEHWVVVKGSAWITCGDKEYLLTQNQSTYISQDVKHRLTNPNETPLEIIEVQTGSLLDEKDIIRFEDVYGRELAEG